MLVTYNGDTVREMKSYFPNLSGIVAIEPDKKNFKRLLKYAESTDGLRPTVVNAAVHSEMGIAEFSRSGNRNSTLAATASYEHAVDTVSVITVDSLSANADYIKYDVEGAERDALLGSVETVRKCGSRLLVSAYHRSRDIFELPLLLHELFPGKRLVLRRELSLPAWEIDLIAL